MTGWIAGVVARVLATAAPERARGFGLWYRERCVLHPRWVQPVSWEADVSLPGGAVLRAPFREVQGMSLILSGAWERQLTARVRGALEPGCVMVDVGANLGYYTLIASKAVGPEGLVLAFEPSPRNLRHLLREIERNRCANVAVFSEALSDGPGLARLSRSPEFNWGVCSLRDGGGDDGTLTATRRLDDVVGPMGLAGRVSFVKIDTEGTELRVLRGMEGLLRANRRVQVMCELSPDWGPVPELIDFMRGLGFRGEVLDGGDWKPLQAGSTVQGQRDAWFSRP
jgi:FkbM family methyltransferase